MRFYENNFYFLLCLLAFAAFSQEETLFDDLEIIGAFGGPLIDIRKINGRSVQASAAAAPWY
ncbi:MAG: hypothetical protein H6562_03405 [Lewinellaceae bacterium]|nr:hypothetical protein [Lewinellaceae bacterium]